MNTTMEEDSFVENSKAHGITSNDVYHFHGSGLHSVMMEYRHGWNFGGFYLSRPLLFRGAHHKKRRRARFFNRGKNGSRSQGYHHSIPSGWEERVLPS